MVSPLFGNLVIRMGHYTAGAGLQANRVSPDCLSLAGYSLWELAFVGAGLARENSLSPSLARQAPTKKSKLPQE